MTMNGNGHKGGVSPKKTPRPEAGIVFLPGHVFLKPGAFLRIPMVDIDQSVGRHIRGDWGNVCDRDWEQNDRAVHTRGRLFSAYGASNGIRFWIITDAGWSTTTVLLPEEY